MDHVEELIRRLAAGEDTVGDEILELAWTGTTPSLLVAAAFLVESPHGLLRRAARSARSTRDRQLVAIALARAEGDLDRLEALARDHLSDHPDHAIAAWVAAPTIPPTHRQPALSTT